jgi:sugar phosphate isomerase/epimerase
MDTTTSTKQMKFAFSALCCPGWDLATMASRAKQYGFDGVELIAEGLGRDPAGVRDRFSEAGVAIACLASAAAMSGNAGQDHALAEDVKRYIDLAAQVGCRLVKVRDTDARRGRNRATAAVELGEWLAALADHAAGQGVTLVVENALSFRTARELWMVLEQAGHPGVGACWSVFNAATALPAGELPSTSVPVLNSRIHYVQVRDAKLTPQGLAHCRLGEGDVPVRLLLTRLRGIGYRGYVTLEWEKASLFGLPEPEELLPESLARLCDWVKPPVTEAKPKKAEAGAKAAVKPAEKPVAAPVAHAAPAVSQ